MIAAARAVGLVAVAAVIQVGSIGGAEIIGATPDLLLAAVVLVAWQRGSLAGAASGFVGGLLVDVTTLDHLGIGALVFTVAGYWAGRYGETTGRGRPGALYLTVGVLTVAVGLGTYVLHVVVGESVDAGRALWPLVPGVFVNAAVMLLLRAVLRFAVRIARRAVPARPGDAVG